MINANSKANGSLLGTFKPSQGKAPVKNNSGINEQPEKESLQEKKPQENNTTKLDKVRDKLKDIFFQYEQKLLKIENIRHFGFSNKNQEQVPRFIILPLSKTKNIWNVIISLVVLFQSFFIPLDIAANKECFMTEEGQAVIKLITIVIYILFGLDILMNFFTALINEKGEYIYDLKKIAIAYGKKYLVIDICSVIPFDYMYTFDYNICWSAKIAPYKWFLLIRFLKITNLWQMNEIIEKVCPAAFIGLVRLIKIILIYFLIIHCIGVLFTCVSDTFLKKIPARILADNSWESFCEFYSYALFVGIFLILGNDEQFEHNSEKLLSIVINVISLILNANIFGYIAVTLKQTNFVGEGDDNSEKMDRINEFLNFEDVSFALKQEIHDFFALMKKRQKALFAKHDIFEDLNDPLKIISKFEYWKTQYFKHDELFSSDDISVEFFGQCLLVMQAKMYLQDERICCEGEKTMDFYLIPSGGKVAVKVQGTIVRILVEGDFFGETAAFIPSEKRTATVDSLNISDMLYIEGREFLRLMMNFPKEAEYFKEIAKCHIFRTGMMIRNSLSCNIITDNSEPIIKKSLYSGRSNDTVNVAAATDPLEAARKE